MRQSWFAVLMLLASIAAPAQSPPTNPTLIARIRGVDDEFHKAPLRLADLKVDVNIVGCIARATVRAHFSNTQDQALEGDFSLGLPDGATVTGYALDIEGQMIDGVLAEPSHARAVYESNVRQKIDPGLANVSRENVFNTRVYPINEDGRTIRVTFVAPVHALAGWVLPISLNQSVGHVDLRVQVQDVKGAPTLMLPAPLNAEWRSAGEAFVAQVSARSQKLSGELRIGPCTPVTAMLTTVHANGQRFFQLSDTVPATNTAHPAPKRLRVYWDRSRSHQDDDLAAEIALVSRFVEKAKPGAVDVVLFNSSSVTVETRRTASDVTQVLQGVVYRGGTSFAVLQSASVPAASMCLMVSDGVATVDRRDGFKPECEMFALTSAPDADLGYLARLMMRPASDVLRLNSGAPPDELLARLLSVSPTIVDVRDSQGMPLEFTTLPGPRGVIAAVGKAPASGDIVVRVNNGPKLTDRRYATSSAPLGFDGAGALWAADQVTRLAAADRKPQALDVARRYEVASPHLSFVVLESPWQYANAEIAPPKRYPKEWREQYLEAAADQRRNRKEARAHRLAEVIEQWQARKEWWAETFDSAAPAKSNANLRSRSADGSFNSPMSMLEEVSVTGARVVPTGAHIELEPWNVNRPYIKALKAAPQDRVAEVLAAQEMKYGNLPAFYLDVAEWFYRQQRTPEAIELALTALELPARNDETLAIVADRMSRYGDLDRAISLFERLLELAPDRPQPRRSLALALAEHAKQAAPAAAASELQRALSLLNEVILTPWDDAYAGIELIALMEANAIVPRLKKLGVQAAGLDRRLVARLDVDLRIVIEWNTAATDIDLWVEEPNGETAMYSNPNTAIGGHLSNDMRAGFGPEEYLLRRAPNGAFKIKADVFAVDALNPNGASTVTARLIYDYGRPTERVERRDIELKQDDDTTHDGVLVGKVRFDRPPHAAEVAQK